MPRKRNINRADPNMDDHRSESEETPFEEASNSSTKPSEHESENQSRPPSPTKNGVFPVGFAELFKDARKPAPDGVCTYIPPKQNDILEVEESDIDTVIDLWGVCLLGCFAGQFSGLKAVQALVDSWKVECKILPHFLDSISISKV